MGSGLWTSPKVDVVGICNVVDDEILWIERFSVAVVVMRVVVTRRGGEQGGHHPRRVQCACSWLQIRRKSTHESGVSCKEIVLFQFGLWTSWRPPPKRPCPRQTHRKRRRQIRAFPPVGSPSTVSHPSVVKSLSAVVPLTAATNCMDERLAAFESNATQSCNHTERTHHGVPPPNP